MLIILLRTVILYMVSLFVIRIMGKGELTKMDPFQMVVLFMIAELATFPIESEDIPIFTGITAMLGLLFLQTFISWISKKNQKVSEFLSGRPSLLIDKGIINEKELRDLRISITDLTEQLRLKNIPCLSDVEYAILEANGDLSVIQKSGKRPLTREDMNLPEEDEFLPVTLIADGQLCPAGLKLAKLREKDLQKEIRKHNVSLYKEVLFAFYDNKGGIQVYPREKKTAPGRKS